MPTTGGPSASDENRRAGFLAFVSVLLAITAVPTLLRFWSRSLASKLPGQRRFQSDDWVSLAAAVAVAAEMSIAIALVQLGGGRHVWFIPSSNLKIVWKLFFVIYMFHDIGITLARASALLFLSRVFPAYVSPR
ncbi:hypothetical protein GGS20DRAFT_208229 [Poronia punctata]|nr:hypothetical protein GGS20DRAFT_208229 [Poronia punctata]